MSTQVAQNGSDCKYGVHHWQEMQTVFKDAQRQRCIHCNIQRTRYFEGTSWTDWKPAKVRKP